LLDVIAYIAAQFWEAVAKTCAGHPGLFAYNLMNEPVASGARRPAGEWVHPTQMEGLQSVEFIDFDPVGRKPAKISRQWLRRIEQTIRKQDQRHLVTVVLLWRQRQAWRSRGIPTLDSRPRSGFPLGPRISGESQGRPVAPTAASSSSSWRIRARYSMRCGARRCRARK